ncbi:hypothetical protein [Azospirillum endophyticum]
MAPVPHLSYVVFQNENHWTIGFGEGDGCGRFPSRREALESAMRDAWRVRELGCDVDVFVRRKNGTLRRLRDGIGAGSSASTPTWTGPR